MRSITALLVLIAACGHRPPSVPFTGDLGAFLAAHPLAEGQAIRADEVGRTASASYHVVQVRGSERPHRHVMHELTVLVVRGHGTLTRGAERVPLRAGDLVVVPRDVPHWFVNEAADGSVSFAIYTPPLDAPDTVPVDLR